jgi:hypothetical protein|tara:strand:+ start:1387 stop:1878 length:492 start_codon:yes stop_codon:yes gene_type:complete
MSLTIYSVPNFEKHRVKFLELIYKIPETKYKDISHTDWEIPRSMRREYVEYFNENIYQGYRDNLCKENQFKDFEISNMWFQVYREGDKHETHTHPHAHFTNVFYINLPDKKLTTEIRKINHDCKEGDIITFPAYYEHGSPINTNKQPKVIISFNINIFSYANL